MENKIFSFLKYTIFHIIKSDIKSDIKYIIKNKVFIKNQIMKYLFIFKFNNY